jgi:hypothetical protein
MKVDASLVVGERTFRRNGEFCNLFLPLFFFLLSLSDTIGYFLQRQHALDQAGAGKHQAWSIAG